MNGLDRAKPCVGWAVLGAIASALVGCADVTSPDSRDDRALAPAFAVGDVTGPQGVLVPPWNDIAVPPTMTGIGLLPDVPYRVSVSGMLTFQINPKYSQCGDPNTLPTIPQFGPAGFYLNGWKWRVAVGIGTQTAPPGSELSLQPQSSSAAATSGYLKGPGMLWVSRNAVPHACAGPGVPHTPAWKVTGSQSLEVEELEPPRVVPDKELVAAGDTVRFDIQIAWATSFFIGWGGGWRWVPDTTTNTSTMLGCSRFQNWCRVVVRERGHVEVENIVVNGVLSFLGKSPIVEVGAERVRIRSVSGPLAVRPLSTGGSATLPLEVSVVSQDGTVLPNRTVDLSLDGVEGTGGHQHGGSMPPGAVVPCTVNTGASGIATVTYSAGVFAGNVEVRGTSSGAVPARETITVRVPGLVQLVEAGNVDTIGPTTTHPSNHWGSPEMISGLVALADGFRAFTQNSKNVGCQRHQFESGR